MAPKDSSGSRRSRQKDQPDYIVLRPSADFPPQLLPQRWDGLWLDFGGLANTTAAGTAGQLYGYPTGRFEVRRSDLVVAEVWEVRPPTAPPDQAEK